MTKEQLAASDELTAYNRGYDDGFAAAREAAAQVCHNRDDGTHEQIRKAHRRGDHGTADVLSAILQESAAIADEIRTLTPDTKEPQR